MDHCLVDCHRSTVHLCCEFGGIGKEAEFNDVGFGAIDEKGVVETKVMK
jgi:hypothetical protein